MDTFLVNKQRFYKDCLWALAFLWIFAWMFAWVFALVFGLLTYVLGLFYLSGLLIIVRKSLFFLLNPIRSVQFFPQSVALIPF